MERLTNEQQNVCNRIARRCNVNWFYAYNGYVYEDRKKKSIKNMVSDLKCCYDDIDDLDECFTEQEQRIFNDLCINLGLLDECKYDNPIIIGLGYYGV